VIMRPFSKQTTDAQHLVDVHLRLHQLPGTLRKPEPSACMMRQTRPWHHAGCSQLTVSTGGQSASMLTIQNHNHHPTSNDVIMTAQPVAQ
jgi:hypothetical protein